MERTDLLVTEPFVEDNKNLANTVILYADWIFYIDKNLNVFARSCKCDKFYIDENDTHNHWYGGHDETDLAIVLASDVEPEKADEVADQFIQYAYKYEE